MTTYSFTITVSERQRSELIEALSARIDSLELQRADTPDPIITESQQVCREVLEKLARAAPQLRSIFIPGGSTDDPSKS